MPNKIKPKRSYTTNAVPTAADLEVNELAINWADGIAYTKDASGQIVSLAMGGGGGSSSDSRWNLFLPAAPTGLEGTAGDAEVSLSWTAPTGVLAQTPITDYVVQYSADGGTNWATFADGTSTATTATVTGLTNGTEYTFRVAAVNGVGTGSFSDSVAVTPSPVATDPDFASVSLLLHMDGSGATFADNSGTPKTVTANGNATQSSTQSKFGGKSLYLDGSGDFVDVPLSAALQFDGDFTIEFWLYFVARDSNGASIFNNYNSFGSGSLALFAGHSAANTTKYQIACDGSFPAISSNSSIAYNQWDHFAVVRSGTTLTLYINGASEGTFTASSAINGAGSVFRIGSAQDSPTLYETNGYIDDFRVTNGVARYTANFTPPTAPFPDA